MDRRERFSARLALYLSGRGSSADGGVIKRHVYRDGGSGEFSISKLYDRNDPKLKEFEGELIETTVDWPLAVNKCRVLGERLHLFLDRTSSIERCLKDSSSGSSRAPVAFSVSIEDEIPGDLTHFRVRLLAEAAERLAAFKGYRLVPNNFEESHSHVHFCSKSSSAKGSAVRVVCGPVLNARTGSKETEITAEQYLEKRLLDMKLKSQHKYRVIVTDEIKWNESLTRLGKACATIDLVQIKPTHPVRINMTDGGTGSSRGASFILYNSARLSCIIKTFEEKVAAGNYPPLPPPDEIDFSALQDEDEWNIVYNYIADYPGVVESSFLLENGGCEVGTHKLCSYLNGLVGRFSVFYRRIRILLVSAAVDTTVDPEPRDHLLPKIFARIYLLMKIRDVISSVLSIFNIEILSEM